MPPENFAKENIPPRPDAGTSPIHTYKSDVAEFIKREGKTLSDIAIAESKKRADLLREESVKSEKIKKSAVFAVVAFSLLGISALIILIAFMIKSQPVKTNTETPFKKIFVSDIKEKDLVFEEKSAVNMLRELDRALKESNPFLSLNIYLKNKDGGKDIIAAREFLETIGIYPPSDLARSIRQNFAIGSIGGRSRFLVLKTDYYPGAFSGMFQWEKEINSDLLELLSLSLPNSQKISSTTPANPKLPTFSDEIIMNRDVRILKDNAGVVLLLYFFPDQETVVITDDENAAKIINEKLLSPESL